MSACHRSGWCGPRWRCTGVGQAGPADRSRPGASRRCRGACAAAGRRSADTAGTDAGAAPRQTLLPRDTAVAGCAARPPGDAPAHTSCPTHVPMHRTEQHSPFAERSRYPPFIPHEPLRQHALSCGPARPFTNVSGWRGAAPPPSHQAVPQWPASQLPVQHWLFVVQGKPKGPQQNVFGGSPIHPEQQLFSSGSQPVLYAGQHEPSKH
jgi:hypothetical protein